MAKKNKIGRPKGSKDKKPRKKRGSSLTISRGNANQNGSSLTVKRGNA